MELNFDEAIKEINSINDLKTVVGYYGIKLSTKGNYTKAICPFHKEKTPSFSLNDEGSGAYYNCFGCGAGGNVINFIKDYKGLSTLEALKEAYEILGKKLDIKPSKIDRLINYIETNDFYKLEDYYIEDVYIYMVDTDVPSFLKIRYKLMPEKKDTGKKPKDMRTYKIVDAGEYYKTTTKASGGEYEPIIYNYPAVKKAIEKDNNIYFVEGEKDVKTLQRLGLTTTTIYNTKKWFRAYTDQLNGAKVVFIGDTGKAGEEFKKTVYENLKEVVKTFKVVDLPNIEALGDNADVTDWLNIKGNTKEKLIEAIKESWDLKVSEKWADVDIKESKKGIVVTPKKTLRNFEIMLKRANTDIHFNEISKQLEIKTTKFENKNLNTFATEIYSHCQIEGLKLTENNVMKYIDAVGYKKAVNPFKEYLNGLKGKWDGKSRLKDFYDIFICPETYDNSLKELILYKWLLQFIGSAYDENFKSPGLVVLKGRQGLGKTSIFEKLIPINEDWVFLSEQKFTGGDRDNIQTITTNQLVELSEFARSNKLVDALKGFITSPADKLVLKYDKHPVKYKRKTVYYATINDDEFLIDNENRRFWVIDLISINLNHNVDFEQLWAEMYHIYHNEGIQNYWLNQEEQARIEKSNQNYKFKGDLETSIEKAFDFMDKTRLWLTSVEVAEYLNKDISQSKITRCLNKMEIEQRSINNKDIPRGKYNAMPMPKAWGKEIPASFKKRVINQLVEVTKEHTQEYIIEELTRENQLLKQQINYLEAKLNNLQIELNVK